MILLPTHLLPFIAVAAVITVTPGPDLALILRNGLRGGATAAWWTGLGTCCGTALHASAAVIGLSALLAASAAAFTVVKLAGATYLVFLGLSALWHTRRRGTRGPQGDPPPTPRVVVTQGMAFRQGVLNNLTNPKMVLLFLTLLPQFVSTNEPRLATTGALAVVFLVLSILWWRAVSLLVAVLSRVLSSPTARVRIDRVTGLVLIALGLTVALDNP